MRIAIVDDNKTEQERLSALIRAWAQDEAVITETFDSGEEEDIAEYGGTFDFEQSENAIKIGLPFFLRLMDT